ncbi:hypothetical protein HanPI659440_Chr08g0284001 [Helianthus annuus]|nr:hypothetical protein HanPI659440_Chr08g0284001 [Helianthus annuus]
MSSSPIVFYLSSPSMTNICYEHEIKETKNISYKNIKLGIIRVNNKSYIHILTGLLLKQREERLTWRVLVEEMKKLGFVAGPMVAVTLSQYLLQVISVMMVGHLGELALSSTSIAISLSSVTGFSLMVSHLPFSLPRVT